MAQKYNFLFPLSMKIADLRIDISDLKYLSPVLLSVREQISMGGFGKILGIFVPGVGDHFLEHLGIRDHGINGRPVFGGRLDFDLTVVQDATQDRLLVGNVVDLLERAFLGNKGEDTLLIDDPEVRHDPDIPPPIPLAIAEKQKGDEEDDQAGSPQG
jgi:hypothetical protein